MANEIGDFSANVAHFKAIADEKLARLRASATFHGFIDKKTLDAFARVDSSAFAGRSVKRSQAD